MRAPSPAPNSWPMCARQRHSRRSVRGGSTNRCWSAGPGHPPRRQPESLARVPTLTLRTTVQTAPSRPGAP
ncbi:hypothetical protein CBM2637_A120339 [Cupriavidus taiwanensis]|nr:hypothetical protein CBM2637_A120339 [Cupriavidus taiwanensis]SPA49503.1 protein of unknown function [Cupriavidus taiwanensis]